MRFELEAAELEPPPPMDFFCGFFGAIKPRGLGADYSQTITRASVFRAKMVTNVYDIIVQYMTTYIHTRLGCRTSCIHDYDECVGGSETSSLREGSIIASI